MVPRLCSNNVFVLSLGIVTLHLLGARAANTSAARTAALYECRWTDEAITVDGRADEPIWKRAQAIDHFYLPWLDTDARPARTGAAARLLWDREYLYFLADFEDADLFADVTEHDGMTWMNDVFELFIKPAADKPGYYELHVNAANTRMDLFIPRRQTGAYVRYKDQMPFHFQSAVVRRGTLNQHDDMDEGWTVEGRIPWRDFIRTGGRPAIDETWRFAICRYDYTKRLNEPELSTCAPLTEANFHRHEDYASLQFVGPKKAELNGTPRRIPWTTSRVKGTPEPPKPFRVVRTYPGLNIDFPICVRPVPGTDQMLLIDEYGPYRPARLLQARDDQNVDTFEVLIDFKDSSGVAYDIAFHPRFAHNGYVYLGLTRLDSDGVKKSQVVRYEMQTRPPHRFNTESAQIIIQWPSDGHNGAAIAFGNDGMLYVTSGDGTGHADGDMVGQRLDVLQSKVLRIDVDHPDKARPYSVPSDNPFVGMAGARPETWAYGLRNPWRIAVDRKMGHIWVGNNGEDLWEQVYLIRRGANYGWSVFEGSHSIYPSHPRGPTPIDGPTLEHDHSEARSLTGGCVYYGQVFPELIGAYVYGDHSTGKIWAAKHDGQKVLWHQEVADTTLSITCITSDRNGELLITDHRGDQQGGLYRLERNPARNQDVQFPRRLSDTGLFDAVTAHQVQPGVISYSVNVPAWHDGAIAQRYLGLPATRQDDESWEMPTMGFKLAGTWGLPEGTVLAQSLALEMEQGKPTSRQWVETRLLTLQEGEWNGYSYLWNDEQTDALLVNSEGAQKTLMIRRDGDVHQQTWQVPSRSECLACHARQPGFVLGFSTLQLNRLHDYDGVSLNQLFVMEQMGLLRIGWKSEANAQWRDDLRHEYPQLKTREEVTQTGQAIGKKLGPMLDGSGQRQSAKSAMLYRSPEKYDRLANPADEGEDLGRRARAYLHVNCAGCHQRFAGGNARMELLYRYNDAVTNIFDVKPIHSSFGIPDARRLVPGVPHRSLVHYRMATLAGGRMPRVGSHQVDVDGLRLIRRWIASLGPADKASKDLLQRVAVLANSDVGESTGAVNDLLSTTSGALALVEAIDNNQFSPALREVVVQAGVHHGQAAVQHLFERFIPEQQRVRRLGTHVDPQQILLLRGNASRGRKLMLENTSLSCLSCHRLEGQGHAVGPNFDSREKKYTRGQILENLLDPSRNIDEKYATYTLATEDGLIQTGVLVERTEDFVVLKQASGKEVRVDADEVDLLARQPKSLMPDHLLKDLTAQQAADLLAFLVSLSLTGP